MGVAQSAAKRISGCVNMETIFAAIEQLIRYAEQRGLLAPEDVVYARNRLLATLRLTEWQPAEVKDVPLASPAPVLDAMIDWAYEQGLLETNTTTERDIWDARLMDCVMPRPSEVIRAFYERYRRDPQEATDWFYSLSQASNYIQTARIANNQH